MLYGLYEGPMGNIRTFFWKAEQLTVTIVLIFLQSDIKEQEKEERKSRTFMSIGIKLDRLHQDLDRGSFNAGGTVEQFSNGSDVCFIFLIFMNICFPVFTMIQMFTSLLISKVVFLMAVQIRFMAKTILTSLSRQDRSATAQA